MSEFGRNYSSNYPALHPIYVYFSVPKTELTSLNNYDSRKRHSQALTLLPNKIQKKNFKYAPAAQLFNLEGITTIHLLQHSIRFSVLYLEVDPGQLPFSLLLKVEYIKLKMF